MEISDIPDRTATTTLPHSGSDLRKRTIGIPQVSGSASETKDPDPGSSVSEPGKSCEDEGNRSEAVIQSANHVANGNDGGDKTANCLDRISDFAAMKLAYRPSAPAHRSIKEGPLSSEAIFKESHAGLLNLCIVVLVAVNSRLIVENLMKYGLLIRTGFWFSSRSLRDWPLLMCCLTLPIFPLAAFIVEKLAQQKYIHDPVRRLCCFIWCHIDALRLHCMVKIGILCAHKL